MSNLVGPFENVYIGESMEYTVCGNIYFSKTVNAKSYDAAREKVECMDYEVLTEGLDGVEVISVTDEKSQNTVYY